MSSGNIVPSESAIDIEMVANARSGYTGEIITLNREATTDEFDKITGYLAWKCDTGLTIFKMSKTITLPTNQTVPVRILGSISYEPNAYLYIDPIPVVT